MTLYRINYLLEHGLAEGIVHKYSLAVHQRGEALWADWRLYRWRFPGLERAMERFRQYIEGDERVYPALAPHQTIRDLLYVNGVLRCWAEFYAFSEDEKQFARSLVAGSKAKPVLLKQAYLMLRSWGVDPL